MISAGGNSGELDRFGSCIGEEKRQRTWKSKLQEESACFEVYGK